MAILYDWYENPGESDDSEEKGLHPRIFLIDMRLKVFRMIIYVSSG